MFSHRATLPADLPVKAQQQLEKLCAELQDRLAENLIGIYLHGSLSMGCFNPARSDLDLLVMDRAPLSPAHKRELTELLLYLSNRPIPIEIHFLVYADLHPWHYPPPYDLHYSEGWRARFEEALPDNDTQIWNNRDQRDPDLGAHISVVRARGVALLGPPVETVFPIIPRADYLAAVLFDLKDGFQEIGANPVYHVLNFCRTLGYMQTGCILSKAEGGEWGLANLPDHFHPIIKHALEYYTHAAAAGEFTTDQLVDFVRYTQSILQPD